MGFINFLNEIYITFHEQSPIRLLTGAIGQHLRHGFSTPHLIRSASICALLSFIGGIYAGAMGTLAGSILGLLAVLGLAKFRNGNFFGFSSYLKCKISLNSVRSFSFRTIKQNLCYVFTELNI